MTNNDVLKKLRYAFDFSDDETMNLFTTGGYDASRSEISNWMKKEEHEEYVNLTDKMLATFLNGLIILKRGKKDGVTPVPENKMSNNLILRKMKIAFNLRDEDMVAILNSCNFDMSKSEINAFFRKPGNDKYRECKDQVLRIFLQGIIIKNRPSETIGDSDK